MTIAQKAGEFGKKFAGAVIRNVTWGKGVEKNLYNSEYKSPDKADENKLLDLSSQKTMSSLSLNSVGSQTNMKVFSISNKENYWQNKINSKDQNQELQRSVSTRF